MPIEGRAPSEGAALNGLTRSGCGRDAARNGEAPGPSGLGQQRMVEIQRARMLVAMLETCAENGPAHVTVAEVVGRAGVSRRTFYEIFDDCEDCLLATLDDSLRRASEHVLVAYRSSDRWSEAIRAALVALLEFLDAQPIVGRLLIVGSLNAGSAVLERRRRVLAQIIVALDEGRGQSRAGKQLPPLTTEGILGAVLSILHTRLLASQASPMTAGSRIESHEDEPLLQLTGPLMSMMVLPYLGPAAARRELRRPVPEPAHSGVPTTSDPLRDIGLRLTYRTVRVLVSIAEKPGSSNREIGDAAGVPDQGQMSKLLRRLERSRLIRNTGLGPGIGAPNAWTLTDRGKAIHAAITVQTPAG